MTPSQSSGRAFNRGLIAKANQLIFHPHGFNLIVTPTGLDIEYNNAPEGIFYDTEELKEQIGWYEAYLAEGGEERLNFRREKAGFSIQIGDREPPARSELPARSEPSEPISPPSTPDHSLSEKIEEARLAAEAARLAEAERLVEKARLAAEEAEKARLAEEARLAAEEAEKARLAEEAVPKSEETPSI